MKGVRWREEWQLRERGGWAWVSISSEEEKEGRKERSGREKRKQYNLRGRKNSLLSLFLLFSQFLEWKEVFSNQVQKREGEGARIFGNEERMNRRRRWRIQVDRKSARRLLRMCERNINSERSEEKEYEPHTARRKFLWEKSLLSDIRQIRWENSLRTDWSWKEANKMTVIKRIWMHYGKPEQTGHKPNKSKKWNPTSWEVVERVQGRETMYHKPSVASIGELPRVPRTSLWT